MKNQDQLIQEAYVSMVSDSALNFDKLHLEPTIGSLDKKINGSHDFMARVQALHGTPKSVTQGSKKYFIKKNKIVATYNTLDDTGHVYTEKSE